MKIVRKQDRVMGRMTVRTSDMDSRVPRDEVWIRHDSVGAPAELIKQNPRDACYGCRFFSPGRYGLGKCNLRGEVMGIDETCDQFASVARAGVLLVNPSKYRHERLKEPSHFDKRSFRTVSRDGHKARIGCRKGHWKRGRCDIGTEAQAVLHPKTEENPCHFVYAEVQTNPEMAGAETPDRWFLYFFTPTKLDPLEQRLYWKASGTPQHRVRVLVDSVEGDTSQMSPYLQEAASRLGLNPRDPTEPRKVRAESGEEITIQVPADFERRYAALEAMRPIYEKLFQSVSNKDNWKLPIAPITFDNETPAQLMRDAIAFYHGGAEMERRGDSWVVYSKGYYIYIGA